MRGGHHYSPPQAGIVRKLPHPIMPLVTPKAQPGKGGGTHQTQCKQEKHFSSCHPGLVEDRPPTEGRPQPCSRRHARRLPFGRDVHGARTVLHTAVAPPDPSATAGQVSNRDGRVDPQWREHREAVLETLLWRPSPSQEWPSTTWRL